MEENNKSKIDIRLGRQNKDKNKADITHCIAWISTSVAVVAGICITKDPGCLWAFLIPAMLS